MWVILADDQGLGRHGTHVHEGLQRTMGRCWSMKLKTETPHTCWLPPEHMWPALAGAQVGSLHIHGGRQGPKEWPCQGATMSVCLCKREGLDASGSQAEDLKSCACRSKGGLLPGQYWCTPWPHRSSCCDARCAQSCTQLPARSRGLPDSAQTGSSSLQCSPLVNHKRFCPCCHGGSPLVCSSRSSMH